MKYFYLFITISLHFLSLLTFNPLGNFGVLTIILFGSVLLGFGLKYIPSDETSHLKKISWGLLYGSLLSLALIFLAAAWILANFRP
jgi:hypothetical protein